MRNEAGVDGLACREERPGRSLIQPKVGATVVSRAYLGTGDPAFTHPQRVEDARGIGGRFHPGRVEPADGLSRVARASQTLGGCFHAVGVGVAPTQTTGHTAGTIHHHTVRVPYITGRNAGSLQGPCPSRFTAATRYQYFCPGVAPLPVYFASATVPTLSQLVAVIGSALRSTT